MKWCSSSRNTSRQRPSGKPLQAGGCRTPHAPEPRDHSARSFRRKERPAFLLARRKRRNGRGSWRRLRKRRSRRTSLEISPAPPRSSRRSSGGDLKISRPPSCSNAAASSSTSRHRAIGTACTLPAGNEPRTRPAPQGNALIESRSNRKGSSYRPGFMAGY